MASISSNTFRVVTQFRSSVTLAYERGKSGRTFILEIMMLKSDLSLYLVAFEVQKTPSSGHRKATIRSKKIKFAMYLAYKKWRRRGEWQA